MIKKVITIAALALATGTGFAQDEKNRSRFGTSVSTTR